MTNRLKFGLSIEASYLNQLIRVDGGEDRVNHLDTLNFKVKL